MIFIFKVWKFRFLMTNNKLINNKTEVVIILIIEVILQIINAPINKILFKMLNSQNNRDSSKK